jgi:hypothetical protein
VWSHLGATATKAACEAQGLPSTGPPEVEAQQALSMMHDRLATASALTVIGGVCVLATVACPCPCLPRRLVCANWISD